MLFCFVTYRNVYLLYWSYANAWHIVRAGFTVEEDFDSTYEGVAFDIFFNFATFPL
jgi:hypothetical protein